MHLTNGPLIPEGIALSNNYFWASLAVVIVGAVLIALLHLVKNADGSRRFFNGGDGAQTHVLGVFMTAFLLIAVPISVNFYQNEPIHDEYRASVIHWLYDDYSIDVDNGGAQTLINGDPVTVKIGVRDAQVYVLPADGRAALVDPSRSLLEPAEAATVKPLP